ncbi:MAG TPA: hypothetical protein VJ901_00070 [Thermoanaerobaculia bacterium]|nr:hypothetical protein [Thermoanaerobaculia bacterium]
MAISDSSIFGALSSAQSPLLSVGYVRDLPATSTRLSSASGTTPGGSMRVTIVGGARADAYRAQSGGVAVDLVSASGQRVCFWSASKTSVGGYASTVLPSVSLSVKSLTAKSESVLGISRPGVYVIAVRESTSDAAPDWNRLDLVHQGSRYLIPGATFSYALLKVE